MLMNFDNYFVSYCSQPFLLLFSVYCLDVTVAESSFSVEDPSIRIAPDYFNVTLGSLQDRPVIKPSRWTVSHTQHMWRLHVRFLTQRRAVPLPGLDEVWLLPHCRRDQRSSPCRNAWPSSCYKSSNGVSWIEFRHYVEHNAFPTADENKP